MTTTPGNHDQELHGYIYNREKLMTELGMMLGGGMVDIELDPEHYDLAIDLALDRYRQRASNSVEEKFSFIELQPDQQVYVLPREVKEVRQILRRGIGGQTGGSQIDPFAMSYTNLYLRDAGRQGGLLTFDLFHQFQEVAGRLFGRDLNYHWNPTTRQLTVHRQIHTPETAVLWIYTFRPEVEIFNDDYARPWIRSFALAQAKLMLGTAYAKFQTIVGPQGGTSLPGDALKSEAMAELERLEEELKNYIDGSESYSFLIG